MCRIPIIQIGNGIDGGNVETFLPFFGSNIRDSREMKKGYQPFSRIDFFVFLDGCGFSLQFLFVGCKNSSYPFTISRRDFLVWWQRMRKETIHRKTDPAHLMAIGGR